MNKKILVGCPIYEGDSEYLEGYLETLKQQTVQDFDIILVNTTENKKFEQKLKETETIVFNAYSKTGGSIDNIIVGRNKIREYFLEHDYEYLFFVDSDVILPKDALKKLISTKKDLISGIYLMLTKNQIPKPCVWAFTHQKGKVRQVIIEEIQKKDLFKVAIVGFGCVLLTKKIMQEIKFDKFEGQTGGEDAYFCIQALKKGYEILVDGRVRCNHLQFNGKEEKNKKLKLIQN